MQKLRAKSIDDKAVKQELNALGVSIIPFSLEHADKAGELWQMTAPFGLSLGDRACLATGLVENMPVMTTDKIWQQVQLPLDIHLIR